MHSLYGKCREYAEQAVRENPLLRLVRGYYHCPIWGKRHHWWTVKPDGKIYDPTEDQFPSKGIGEYEEFDGYIICEKCGTRQLEEKAQFVGSHSYCSYECCFQSIF
jgi:hypothetical protein